MAEEKEKRKVRISKDLIKGAVLGIAIGLIFAFSIAFNKPLEKPNYLTKEEAAKKALNWLTGYFASRGMELNVNITSVNDTEEGVYKLTLEISNAEGKATYTSYITKDGKLLFPQGIDISKEVEMPEVRNKNVEMNKTEKPEVRLFIMSYCPYGLQAVKAMVPVFKLLKDKADIDVSYVIYKGYGRKEDCLANGTYCSMHGWYELEEDIRQLCIKQEYGKEKLWEYLDFFAHNCSYENKQCWISALEKTGINKSRIDACVEKEIKEEGKNLIAPQYLLDQKYGVSGSPTLIINGKRVSVARSPESFKEAICNAFLEPPEECNVQLSAKIAKPGFGGGEGSSSQGNC